MAQQQPTSPRSMQPKGIESMPFEIMSTILQFVITDKDRRSCLTVSRHFYAPAHQVLYSSIQLAPYAYTRRRLQILWMNRSRIRHLLWHLRSHDTCLLEVQELLLLKQESISSPLPSPPPPPPRLQSLIFEWQYGAQEFGLKLMLHNTATLTHLALSTTDKGTLFPLDQVLDALPHLITLDFPSGRCKLIDLNSQHDGQSSDHWCKKPPLLLRRLQMTPILRRAEDAEQFFARFAHVEVMTLQPKQLLTRWKEQAESATSLNAANMINMQGMQGSPDDLQASWVGSVMDRYASLYVQALVKACSKLRSFRLNSSFQNVVVGWSSNGTLWDASLVADTSFSPPMATAGLLERVKESAPGLIRLWQKTCPGLRAPDFAGIAWQYFTRMDLSLGLPRSGNRRDPNRIQSFHIQTVLETCSQMRQFLAINRELYAEDLFNFTEDPTPLPRWTLEEGYNNDSQSDGKRIPKPWACESTLQELHITLRTRTANPRENQIVYAQLGRLRRLTYLKLYRSSLVPSLSHGLGALKDLKLLTTYGSQKCLWPCPNEEAFFWMRRHWPVLTRIWMDLACTYHLQFGMRRYGGLVMNYTLVD